MVAAQFSKRNNQARFVMFFLCLWGLISVSLAGQLSASRQKLQVKKHLNRLNKPPIKTIQSPDGDIIDCVHISHQPAFDHPFLRDHKIQTRPNYHPEGLFDDDKISTERQDRVNDISQLWHMNGQCPEDTIPIRRTKKEEVLRSSSVKMYGKKKHRTIPKPRSADPDLINQSGHQERSIMEQKQQLMCGNPKYSSLMSSVSPKFRSWVVRLVKILTALKLVGRFVQISTGIITLDSSLIGPDAYQATGCYNLLCSSFIQVNNEIAMGVSISPVSAFRNSQYDISILIWKDPNEGNWWMEFGSTYVLGYWPSFLFSYLVDSASMIEWGSIPRPKWAVVVSRKKVLASRAISRIFKSSTAPTILRLPKLGTFTEKSNCYDVQTDSNGDWGHYFYYGGPSRNPNCP